MPATTPQASFGADGGLLPLRQYVEQQTALRALMSLQAYDDTGARRYGASIISSPPSYEFSADGGIWPLAMVRTDQRPSRMSLMFSPQAIPTPPVYYNVQLIPNIFFVECNELVSVLNYIINVVNSNAFALGVSPINFMGSWQFIHPGAFNDALNETIDAFNYLINTWLKIDKSKNIKLFLSVPPAEITNAINVLINEINVIFYAYFGGALKSNLPGAPVLLLAQGGGNVLQVSGGLILL
jgi:hypothetical protein